MSIYVVARDWGYEGYGLPFLAFTDKDTAIAWCRSQSDCFDIAEVPIFPELPSRPPHALEPLMPKEQT
jgi:hypothetical protein